MFYKENFSLARAKEFPMHEKPFIGMQKFKSDATTTDIAVINWFQQDAKRGDAPLALISRISDLKISHIHIYLSFTFKSRNHRWHVTFFSFVCMHTIDEAL